MKHYLFIITLGLLISLILFNCNSSKQVTSGSNPTGSGKNGILINTLEIPFDVICGHNGKFDKCACTGFGSIEPTSRIYNQSRPSGVGKTDVFNLGRADDRKSRNNTFGVIALHDNEVFISKDSISYDMKSEILKQVIADIKVILDSERIPADILARLSDSINNVFNKNIEIKAFIETYTLSPEIMDNLREAANGNNIDSRFVYAVRILRQHKCPLIREVKVIREEFKLYNVENINDFIIAKLKASLSEDKLKIIYEKIRNKKSLSHFNSSYSQITIYSYGYFSDPWMFQ